MAACLAYVGGWVVFGCLQALQGPHLPGWGCAKGAGLSSCLAAPRRAELQEALSLLAGSHDANEGRPRPGGGEPLSCSCLC